MMLPEDIEEEMLYWEWVREMKEMKEKKEKKEEKEDGRDENCPPVRQTA